MATIVQNPAVKQVVNNYSVNRRNGIKRPLIPYLGSKWRIAPQIIAHMPAHNAYLEPFGGAANVLLCKPPAPGAEVYNDLNEDLVNLFTVLREQPGKLLRLLRRTPYSEAEYQLSFTPSDDPVEQARRLVVRAHYSFHSRAVFGVGTLFALHRGNLGNNASSFASHVRQLPIIAARLRQVTIMRQPALKLIRRLDSRDTLIYADPPYVAKTRKSTVKYCYEMDDEAHAQMLQALINAQSMVLLSGYSSTMYTDMLTGWREVRIPARAFAIGSAPRLTEECLWLNPAAQERLRISAKDKS